MAAYDGMHIVFYSCTVFDLIVNAMCRTITDTDVYN